jgi:hypothetical protein
MVMSKKAVIRNNALLADPTEAFSSPDLVSGIADMINCCRKNAKVQYTLPLKIFIVAGWVYVIQAITLMWVERKIQVDNELRPRDVMDARYNPEVVLCSSKFMYDLEVTDCRFYEYIEEANEFKTCAETDTGFCENFNATEIHINSTRAKKDGSIVATSQTCIKLELGQLSYVSALTTLRCHGNVIQQATPGGGEGEIPDGGGEGGVPDGGGEGEIPDGGGEEEVPDGGGEGEIPDGGGEEEVPDSGGEGEIPDGGGEEEVPDSGGEEAPDSGGEEVPDSSEGEIPDGGGEEEAPDDGGETPEDDGDAAPEDNTETPPGGGGGGGGVPPGGGRRWLEDAEVPERTPGYYLPSALIMSMYDPVFFNSTDDGRKSSQILIDDSFAIVEWTTTRLKDEEDDSTTLQYMYDGTASTTGHSMEGDEFSIIFRPRSFTVKRIHRYYLEFFSYVDEVGGYFGAMVSARERASGVERSRAEPSEAREKGRSERGIISFIERARGYLLH